VQPHKEEGQGATPLSTGKKEKFGQGLKYQVQKPVEWIMETERFFKKQAIFFLA
jgi:hypothetical protein